jgi:hypothetical protein
MVLPKLPKLVTRVRFPSLAYRESPLLGGFLYIKSRESKQVSTGRTGPEARHDAVRQRTRRLEGSRHDDDDRRGFPSLARSKKPPARGAFFTLKEGNRTLSAIRVSRSALFVFCTPYRACLSVRAVKVRRSDPGGPFICSQEIFQRDIIDT